MTMENHKRKIEKSALRLTTRSNFPEGFPGVWDMPPVLLTSRLHEALRLALVADDGSEIDTVPGYFGHPANPFAKYGEGCEPEVSDWSAQSPDRYEYAFEALSLFMRQAGFSREVMWAFNYFMQAYYHHRRGHPHALFEPMQARSKIDSPAKWSVKVWIAIAVEAYILEGIPTRTAASRFIADCLSSEGRNAINLQSLVSSRQAKASRKSFAGVIEDWNRKGRENTIPLEFAKFMFQNHEDHLAALQGRKIAMKSELRLGDLMIANALHELHVWRLADKKSVAALRQNYGKRADIKWHAKAWA